MFLENVKLAATIKMGVFTHFPAGSKFAQLK
jgi:hypothetical protein